MRGITMAQLDMRNYRRGIVKAELPRLNEIRGLVAGAFHMWTYMRGIVAAEIQRQNCLAAIDGKNSTLIGESRRNDSGGTTLADM